MKRDHFYQQIMEGLGGKLDPDLFEDCAVDLLKYDYPGLAPISGGKDAGMDGAIPDGEGEPYPLVTTTHEKVIGNLTENLNSYVRKGRKRRKVVLATSQKLTPLRIQNLYDRATKLGFILVNVHPREDFAQRLYHSPEWCKELLNLTGRPPALSVFPKSERPVINKSLIGREKDLTWLKETKGDRLLVGQPGSGKSYLLRRFAMEGGGLFVVDDDREEIAAGIRSQQPSVLIVDDAQIHVNLLVNLKQMREDLGAEFSILASCWSGDKDRIAQVMTLSEPYIHRLDLLTRAQIVDVVEDADIVGPPEMVQEIVTQAMGRPGLAATLTHLCIHGGVREVFLGNALSDSVRRYFKPRLGSKAVYVLAAFSVGGDVGMAMQTVSDELQLKLIETREIAVELAAGGIIWETEGNKLSVHPPALRHALVRDVFYMGPLSLPIQSFIDKSSDLAQTAHTLLGACARGAKIPTVFLKNLLKRVNKVDVLEHYAWRGAEETVWVLENYPELTVTIANPALEHVPEIIVTRLLEAAVGDNRRLHSTPEHPLRLIDDWVKSAMPGEGKAVKRRKCLIDIACSWLEKEKDAETGLQALQSAFSPICGDFINVPGDGTKVIMRQTYLLLDEMRVVQKQWSGVYQILKGIENIAWQSLQEIVLTWAFPRILNVEITDEMRVLMRSFATQVLNDIASLGQDHPGVLRWANQTSLEANFDVTYPVDQEFEILYPIEDRTHWREAETKHKTLVQGLARNWITKRPKEIAQKIAWIEKEAQLVRVTWPRGTPYLCSEMSKTAESPVEWARSLIEEGCNGELVAPFLRMAANILEEGWQETALECLNISDLKWATISIVLTMNNPPDELLDEVLQNLSGFGDAFKNICLQSDIPVKVQKLLLTHEDSAIASAAAQGEWRAYPKEEVRETLKAEWTSAVVRSRDDSFLSTVLKRDTELAYNWLINFLQDDVSFVHGCDRALLAAISALDTESKTNIMEVIPADWVYCELVHHLVRDDLNLYLLLLRTENLKMFHLVPLTWQSDEVWVDKAKMAMDAGYSPRDIANAAYGYPFRSVSWTGRESLTREKWVKRFDTLCSYDDERIREVGRIGKAKAEVELQNALSREREEDIFGIDVGRRKNRYIS